MQIVWVMMSAWGNVMSQGLQPVQKHLLPTPLQMFSCSSSSGQCIWDGFFLPLETHSITYRGDDKSLARPGRKHARKHVRDARDFNNIETRAFIKTFFL